MFRVTVTFADMQDSGYIYKVGEKFPRAGMTVSDKRLEELSSSRNRRGIPVIIDEDPKEDVLKTEAGVSPSNDTEAKEKPRKRRRKNA